MNNAAESQPQTNANISLESYTSTFRRSSSLRSHAADRIFLFFSRLASCPFPRIMLLTISNLTGCPITALVPSTSSQEQTPSARLRLKKRARCDSELVLDPQIEHLATLPRKSSKEIILRSVQDGQGVSKSDFTLSLSIPRKAIWRHVSVPKECPWRIYIMKVRLILLHFPKKRAQFLKRGL